VRLTIRTPGGSGGLEFYPRKSTVGTVGTTGYATNVPGTGDGIGQGREWAAEFWDGAAWVRPTQTLCKVTSMVVDYEPQAASQNAPVRGGTCYDKYSLQLNDVTIEWDPQLYSTARDKWRITQISAGLPLAVRFNEIQWLEFVRWNHGVSAFGVFAGLVEDSAGATVTVDGGVMPATGKALGRVVPAIDPALGVDYSLSWSSLASGTVRRTDWPGPTASGGTNTDGWLHEVTVIPFASVVGSPALVEGPPAYAWNYSDSYNRGHA